MCAYRTLFTELDRCEYVMFHQYSGELKDYTYNGITYEQTSDVYSQLLDRLYLDFLYEWHTLSEVERKAAQGIVELIVSKRYMNGEFYFDTPSIVAITAMENDFGVSNRDTQLARFVNEMSMVQKFYLQKVAEFLHVKNIDEASTILEISGDIVNSHIESNIKGDTLISEKEWITYAELIQKYDFRGVKSVKDAKWRKKNGFNACVSQSGGKGSAVKYSITKINEWLANGKVSKR